MAKFNWSKFDSSFLKSVIYSDKTSPEMHPIFETDDADLLASSMNAICDCPDVNFIRKYRREVENEFLIRYPDVVKELSDKADCDNYRTILCEWQKRELTSSLADLYIKALFFVGYSEYTASRYSEFTNVRTVDLEKAEAAEEIPLYDFQYDAVDAMMNHFVSKHNKSGMLVMPTGSGKTRTAVAFLLQNMLPRGYQIVWLTHRHELIEQTASAFYKFSPVIKLFSSNIKKFKMVCVSGKHQSMKATEKDDNLMILSVQSVCRNLDFIDDVISDKVIIVVDEAHHTVAPSYRAVINRIRERNPKAKLLGLTATPVRGTESESKYLHKLYDNKIIYSIYMGELITNGVLSKPNFERVETGQNFEPVISIDEKRFIRKWGELPQSLVDRVAMSSIRNEVIVNQYIDNKDIYGKTIIFALNGLHAFTICESLRKAGVRCDFVYTGNTSKRNDTVIRDFKENRLDVLVNINILTEGTDIPDVQSVFLTRPTSSEVLLMQMIGRGMRGVSAGGTKTVTIVDFCDKWDVFNKWLSPELIMLAQAEDPEILGSRTVSADTVTIPWGAIREIYNSITFRYEQGISSLSVPFGWYELLDGAEDYKLIVFEDQYVCYEQIIAHRNELAKSGDISVTALKKYYFNNFVLCPSDRELGIFINYLMSFEEPPMFFKFEQRESMEPYFVAQRIKDEKLDTMEYATEIYNSNPVAQGLYESVEKYRQAVFDCLNYGLKKPEGFTVREIPVERIPFKIDKAHNLDELYQEVVDEMFGGTYEGINSISWTDKPIYSYYGKCYYPDNDIKINVLLNSSRVNKEVIKYIIYHEMLHRDYHNHGKVFKMLEHKYPNYTEHERFLDFKIGEYEFEM
ncbi:MAG: DEAD/DEAH box helicase family protein [Clostridia bacterium]|nr:DEAD/DEAH box helicase family protein [Clostridia bacterium]